MSWIRALATLPFVPAFLSVFLLVTSLLGLGACARIELIESPRTAFASEEGEPKEPQVVWTSRSLDQSFDYLGQVKVRSWTYEGALERLLQAGKQMRADAVIDVHYERVGFLSTMQAFAIKYK